MLRISLVEYGGFKIGDKVRWKPGFMDAGKVGEISAIEQIWPGRVWIGVKTVSTTLPDGRKIFTTRGGDDTLEMIEKV